MSICNRYQDTTLRAMKDNAKIYCGSGKKRDNALTEINQYLYTVTNSQGQIKEHCEILVIVTQKSVISH